MTFGRAWVIGLCVVGLTLFVSGLSMGDTEQNGFFSGSVVFQTEEEYGRFKTALALTDWDLDDVKVLHSDPPILVEFGTRDATHSFPYGVEGTRKAGVLPLVLSGAVLMSVGFVGVSIVLRGG